MEVHRDPVDESSTCARLASTAKTANVIIEQRVSHVNAWKAGDSPIWSLTQSSAIVTYPNVSAARFAARIAAPNVATNHRES